MASLDPGKAHLLTAETLVSAGELLRADPRDLWSVVSVETAGCGFLADRRVRILYERHVFHRRTQGRYSTAANENVSSPEPGGYSAPGVGDQYDRLERAIALDETAALESTSWGLGQVMGYHAAKLGFAGIAEMVGTMADSEGVQLAAMAEFIKWRGLDGALRSHRWAAFAEGYNGPGYRANQYDTRLQAERQRIEVRGMPDFTLRAAQAYLTFLGYQVNGIDGIMGRFTRSAMQDYQGRKGLPRTDELDDATLEALAGDVDLL